MKISAQSVRQESIIENEQKEQDSYTLGCALLTGGGIFFVLNLVFIIPDLLFAFQNSACVKRWIPSYSLTIKAWLLVDAFARLLMTSLILIAGISTYVSQKDGNCLTRHGSGGLFVYWGFILSWVLVGSFMFWGTAHQFPECLNSKASTYLNLYFLVNYLGIILNCSFK